MDKTKPGLLSGHSTSDSDSSYSRSSASSQEGTILLDDPISGINNTLKLEKATLDAGKPSPASAAINWLGSSYTGQDIKVVAHLYEDMTLTDEINTLKEEKAYWEYLAKGASSLQGSFSTLINVNTWADFNRAIDSAIESALGMDVNNKAQQQASNYLKSILRGIDLTSVRSMALQQSVLFQTQKEAEESVARLGTLLKQYEDKAFLASQTIVLGTLQTLSVSIHREREAVRALGKSYAINYTNGPRTIAGSMIFTLFEEHPVSKLIRAVSPKGISDQDYMATLLPDQLPPIDISIIFANEYGSVSRQTLYGLQFVNDGATYSIENLLTEQVMNFVCRDVDIMTAHGNVPLLRTGRISPTELSGSNLLGSSKDYQSYLERLGMRNRFRNR